MPFPMTQIGHLQLSRMLCGTNPFFGFSHFTKARDNWMAKYFTVERIAEVLVACINEGINGTMSSPMPQLYEALNLAEKETGVRMHWILTPSGETDEELKEQIRWCHDHGGAFCMPHTNWTDSRLLINENRIVGLEPVLELIRELGMGTGLSTHRPEVITVCDKAGYDIDSYIQPYNPSGFLCAVETDWMGRIINQTPKPVMCIKPLAAGRILPETGLRFVYGTNKPIDTVVVGFLSPEEVREDIAIARDVIEGLKSERELQYTRSKKLFAEA